GFIPPGLRGFSPERLAPRSNLDEARSLLRQAGFDPDGEGLGPIPVWLSGYGDTEERLVQRLRTVGIRLRLRPVHWFELQKAIDDGRAPIFALGEMASEPEGAVYLASLFRTSGISNGFRYSDDNVDALIDQALATYDSQKHLEL